MFLLVTVLTLSSVSCDSYLDEIPDNRTELDSENKIASILVSAYPSVSPDLFLEQMSDNTDENVGTGYSSFSRFQDQTYAWEDVTEKDNEDPASIWEAHYKAITNANQALEAIREMGSPESLDPYRGEALICRAYAHFVLVSIFCPPYNEAGSGGDLGIPYMERTETTLNPRYDRGNVAEVYARIEKDIEEGLPLISDNAYDVPKYHFNRQAAYAFAARFYLFYRKYDKVVQAANAVLGQAPAGMLRDWEGMGTMTKDLGILSEYYIKAEHKANLLMVTGVSIMGVLYGAYPVGTRYRHHPYTSATEMVTADAPWGNYHSSLCYVSPFAFNSPGAYRFVDLPRYPYLFEYSDPVAQIGFSRTVHVVFTADETLLCRAEAEIMQGDYDRALEDMNLWIRARFRPSARKTLTAGLINDFYDKMAYYEPQNPTIKKKLNPVFTVSEGQQENFIHCILQMRRIENYATGLRWYDTNRYGIVIYRRAIDNNNVVTETDRLEVNDPRRVIQLPADVVSAGMTPNPR